MARRLMAIEDEILAQMVGAVEITDGLDKLAADVCAAAKDMAPVFGDLPPHRTHPEEGDVGEYRDSIHVEDVHGRPDTRRVISRDKKAIWIEIGTKHMPEYAVFARAAKLFGSEGGPSFSASGRDSMADHGVEHAHHRLRDELETLAKLKATDSAAHLISAQRGVINQARIARSAAFRAARPNSRGRGRSR
jgi:hypothetical protein